MCPYRRFLEVYIVSCPAPAGTVLLRFFDGKEGDALAVSIEV
jgi:hypothetical protein